MFIIWPNKKSKGQKKNCFPAQAQAFSWLTSVTIVSSPNGTKVQLCTNFVNERRQNNRSFSNGLNEKACG